MKSCFDLEKALSAWRRSLAYNRAFDADDVEELERHLRDQVAGLTARGMDEETAYHRALGQMGGYGMVEDEYRKVYWGKRRRRRELLREITWRFAMLRNYFKIALRSIRRQKGYAFINIAGLTVGITCCALILLYIRHELSFDRFHENLDRIYRLAVTYQFPGSTFDNALSSAPMAPALLEDYPDVLAAVRFHGGSDMLVSFGNRRFYEDRFFYADAPVFDVFTFPLLKGDPNTALTAPFSVVLTERTAEKYFGDEDPIGKILTVDNEHAYTVTGVMENVPPTSHLRFDFLASFVSLESLVGDDLESWTRNPFFTFVLLPPDADAGDFNEKLAPFIDNHVGEQLAAMNWELRAFLQPLRDIHLHPLANEQQGDIRSVYVFSAIAVLILLIACINFMNLATARSATRAREVGLRKVMGAHRRQLAGQFLGESLLTAGLAALLAIGLVKLLLPGFGTVAGIEPSMHLRDLPILVLGLMGIVVVVGLLSGSYPAFFLTAFRPVDVLKGGPWTKPGRFSLRKGLVIFQFSVSVILLVGTLVVHNQLIYMRQAKLGYDREQVVVVPVSDSLVLARQEAVKTELLQNASVTHVALASRPPGRGTGGDIVRRPDHPDRPPEIKFFAVDPDFVETLGIEMAAGRDFSSEQARDAGRSLILNETAARSFGWGRPEDALGQPLLYFGDQTGTVVGVVRDFHFQPLRFDMQPLMLVSEPDFYQYFLIRIAPGEIDRSIAYLEEVWSRFAPQWPFEYAFLDEDLDAVYRSEQRLGQLFGYFASLAILIACLGLFGLSAYTAEQRTKEIGVRKVLGASVSGIIGLLLKDFVRLVLIAVVIATPLGYFIMNQWLEDFAYRTDLSAWIFLTAGLAALTIALVTVSYQALKAALADPVDSLRYE